MRSTLVLGSWTRTLDLSGMVITSISLRPCSGENEEKDWSHETAYYGNGRIMVHRLGEIVKPKGLTSRETSTLAHD